MGNFDRKNICIKIEVRENLTDPRYIEFMVNRKHWNFSIKEYTDFSKSITAYTEMSNRIISFFIGYKKGILMPDRCGTFEPLKNVFKKENLPLYIEWLSMPAGNLYLKKKYKFDVDIENEYYAAVWEDNKSLTPKRVLPEYMGKITFYFTKKYKIDMMFLEQLLRDFCAYLNTDIGYIFDQESGKILLDIFHPEKNGTLMVILR